MVVLSVVIPCYNEQDNIQVLIDRFQSLAAKLPLFELIFVNDGSRDLTAEKIRSLSVRKDLDFCVRLVHLTRNFGHQRALLAGMRAARGEACVTIDADLQDPPEVIVDMVAKWREGYEIVLGQRLDRRTDSFFKRTTATFFYKIMSSMARGDFPSHVGDFRLVSRKALEVLTSLKEGSLYWRGLVIWIGYKRALVQYSRQNRHAGETKYPFMKMVAFAVDAIFSFSKKPLYLSSFLGIAFSALSAFFLGAYLFMFLIGIKNPIPGWMSLIAIITLMGGLQLFCLGIIGQYVGRIYEEVIGRPQVLAYEPEDIVVARAAGTSPLRKVP